MKVLITGGMGVIGAEASRKFVKEGHRPVIFARHRDESLIGDIVDKVDIETGQKSRVFESKDGGFRANGSSITFSDGRKMFVGSPGTGAPEEKP